MNGQILLTFRLNFGLLRSLIKWKLTEKTKNEGKFNCIKRMLKHMD